MKNDYDYDYDDPPQEPLQERNVSNLNSTSDTEAGDYTAFGGGDSYVSHFSVDRLRTVAGTLVEDSSFQRIVIVLIITNSITMGVGTFDFVTENAEIDRIFLSLDELFLWLFTIELALQFTHKGWSLFFHGWLVFDVVVIFVSWLFGSFSIIRGFRIFRALRLVTRISSLRDLAQVLLSVIPRMFAILLLMAVIYYVFGVMFTSLFKNLYRDGLTSEDYFSRLDVTLFTLFQLMTLDSWSEITRSVMETYPWAWLPFMSYIMISSFVVVNLVIGVICDAVGSMQQENAKREAEEIQAKVIAVTHADIARLEQKLDLLLSNLTLPEKQTTTPLSDRLEQKLDLLLGSLTRPEQRTSNTPLGEYHERLKFAKGSDWNT